MASEIELAREEVRREILLRRFREYQGREPNTINPTRFSDKVLARILGPPDPIYPIIGYKHLVPSFVRSAVGDRVSIARRYLVARKLAPRHLDALPEKFVLKSSFGSGLNQIVTDKSSLVFEDVCEHFNSRLETIRNARREVGEWNCVIAEEYLGDSENFTPNDIKIQCFHRANGGFEYIFSLNTGRHRNLQQSLFDESGKRLPFVTKGFKRHKLSPILPSNLDEIIGVSRDLSKGFDYIRVDIYSINGNIYFGELTPFAHGALFDYDDPEADDWIGSKWDQRTPMYAGY